MAAILPPALEALMRIEGNRPSRRIGIASPLAPLDMDRAQMAHPQPAGYADTAMLERDFLIRKLRQQKIQDTLQGYLPQDMPENDPELAMQRADAILATRPGHAEHQLDLNESRRFSGALDAASDYGERGVRDAFIDEMVNRYPDRAQMLRGVGSVTVGGGDMSHIPHRKPMDGSMGMLSALISGLSGHAAPMQPEPDPQTLVMRTAMSPGSTTPYGHYASLQPQGEEDAYTQALQETIGSRARLATSMDARTAQANAVKTGQGMGIVDQAKYDAIYGPQGSYTQGQQQRQDLVRQRAMQIGQARTNRQSGMDPRTAALLAALGGEEGGLGAMLLADTVLGKGSALKLREQDDNRDIGMAAVDAKRDKNGAPPDLRTSAAKIYADKLATSKGDKAKAANESVIEVMKTGVSEAEAKAAIAEVAGIDSKKMTDAGKPQKKTPLIGAYGGLTREPEWGDVIGAAADTIGDSIRNWDF